MLSRKMVKLGLGIVAVLAGIAGIILFAVVLPLPLIFTAGRVRRTGELILIADPGIALLRAQYIIGIFNAVFFCWGLFAMGLLWPRVDEEIKEKGKIEKMMAVAGLLDDLGYEDVETFIKEKFNPVRKMVKK